MAFSLIVPPSKVKPGKLTLSCNNRQGGDFSLMLSLPHALWSINFGSADHCDVQIGQGSDEGKMLLTAPAEGGGHFKPTFFKTNILIRFPRLDWMPDFKMAPIDPEHRQTPNGLLITMPEWAWNRERQKAIAAAKAQVARERVIEGRGGK